MNIRHVILSTLLVASLVLAACAGGEAPPPALAGTPQAAPRITASSRPTALPPPSPTPTEVTVQGTVSIWHSWPEGDMPALVQISQGFNDLYPDVFFDVQYIPAQDLLRRYADETRQGTGPMILLGPAEWGPGLADDGLTIDASGLLPEQQRQSLNQAALGAAMYRGKLVALPYAIQGVVLYRNKDIITLNPTTFDELVTLAQSSKQGEIQGAILERSFFYSGGHLEGVGGQLMDENGRPAFNNAKGVEWLELLKAFGQAGPPDFFTDQDLEFFKAGKAGFIIEGTWRMQELVEALGAENLTIDPWPAYKDGRLAGYVRAENLYVSPLAQGDAWLANQKFIEYFLSPEAQSYLTDVGRIPAASGVSLADPIQGPLYAQAITALAGGATYPVAPSIALYSVNLDIALRAYLEQGMPAADALRMAQEAIQAGISQTQVTPTPLP